MGLTVEVADDERVEDADLVALRVEDELLLTDLLALNDLLAERDLVLDCVGECVEDALRDEVAVSVLEGVVVGETVFDPDKEAEGVFVGVFVGLTLIDSVREGVWEEVLVCDAESVPDLEFDVDLVCVRDRLEVLVGVTDATFEPVEENVGL